MTGSVSRLPDGPPSDGSGVPPTDIYQVAVEEYRFQATFNWSRTQYTLVFNTGILVAAAAVASRPGHGAAVVFAFGVLACALSAGIVRTQHGYYRAARDRMRAVEKAVGIPEGQRTDTTSTLGRRQRKVSVNQFVYLLLAGLAVGDTVGAVLIALR